MKLSIQLTQREKLPKTSLIVGIIEGGELTPTAKAIDQTSHGFLTKLIKQGAFEGKMGQILPLYHLEGTRYEHVLLVGCGKKGKLSPAGFRKLTVNAVKALSKVTHATTYLTEVEVMGEKSLAWKVKQIAEAVSDGLYRFDLFKSEKEPAPVLKELAIAISEAKQEKACVEALKQGQAVAAGMTLMKNLANTPSNICTPTFLAEQAIALAKDYAALSVEVLGEKEMKKLKMGALLGVSQGSAEEAKLICLEYKGTTKKQAPIALVGKGVTFDSGGNSLKPADAMVGMKYDMCGAASVLGTMKALAELKLPIHIVGIIPAVENMPGGTAYKPEDILTSMSGQTIEVISTDAEGRLILADALTYCERYQPEAVIDIATLTGAVVIALGFHATAILSNNAPLEKALLEAGEESNDRAWPMPLWEEYQEQIKSPFADMANIGGRPAGTITAACFLSRFAKKFHWAHLDVAGTAAMMSGTQERMATGRPVPMLMQYLINRTS
ncbi:MAG: leucyl aminopeptidase [Gammaproteobacteria bacterium]|nr:MAG: leucyl aminopeptidase [Gammaproteobacteria bacterium]